MLKSANPVTESTFTTMQHQVTGTTVAIRGKEDDTDYRFMPEPDLPPLCITDAFIADIRAQQPALPRQTVERLVATYSGISFDDAWLLVCVSLHDLTHTDGQSDACVDCDDIEYIHGMVSIDHAQLKHRMQCKEPLCTHSASHTYISPIPRSAIETVVTLV